MLRLILVHTTIGDGVKIFTYLQICNKFLNCSRTRQHLWLYEALVLVTLLLTTEIFVFNQPPEVVNFKFLTCKGKGQ